MCNESASVGADEPRVLLVRDLISENMGSSLK